MDSPEYCIFYSSTCLPVSDWSDVVVAVAAAIAIPGALVTAYRTLQEMQRGHEQKDREHQLKRTEFTLAQHRRLFDDPELSSILRLIDGDGKELAGQDMWDAKRKFLTFFEEIALLVNSGDIDKRVAFYMFGYYARIALEGKNFKVGIDPDRRYWGLLYSFVEEYMAYFESAEAATPEELRL